MSKLTKRCTTFCALRFSGLGIPLPAEPLQLSDTGRVEFTDEVLKADLGGAEGVLLPQGYNRYGLTSRDAEQLEFQKRVAQMIERGAWVCILIPELGADLADYSGFAQLTHLYRDLDIARWLFGSLGVIAKPSAGMPILRAKDDAFADYVKRFGIAKVIFDIGKAGPDARTLVTSGDAVVGFEWSRSVFVLPVHVAEAGKNTAAEIVRSLIDSINRYRERYIASSPAWLDEFAFGSEQAHRSEMQQLVSRYWAVKSEVDALTDWKKILTTKDIELKKRLVGILRTYFGLTVEDDEEYREDFKLVGADGATIAVCESKGTRAGIKREHVNQVDSHRERNDLPETIPGILFVNNEMGVDGIAARADKMVAQEQVRHARKINVLVLRTIDLLFLMLHLESSKTRADDFVKLVSSGGGWLHASPTGFSIETGQQTADSDHTGHEAVQA
jgi:hypothetical protein